MPKISRTVPGYLSSWYEETVTGTLKMLPDYGLKHAQKGTKIFSLFAKKSDN